MYLDSKIDWFLLIAGIIYYIVAIILYLLDDIMWLIYLTFGNMWVFILPDWKRGSKENGEEGKN